MASKQSEAVKIHWDTSAANMATNPPLDQLRDFTENWATLTAEPGGVDYIETNAGGAAAMWAVPKGCAEDRVVLALHGGGFISGSMYTHRKLFGHVAKRIGCRALILDYRRTPEHGYPAQLDDAAAAYRWLLDQEIPAGHRAHWRFIRWGLAIAALLRVRDLGLPMAAALMPISAWTDMEFSGETYESNREKDVLFRKEIVGPWRGCFWGKTATAEIHMPARFTVFSQAYRRFTCRLAATRRCWMTAGYSPSVQKRLGWMCASMSSLRCCTRSKWLRDVHPKPTMRSAD
jgi:monoterpene epsilon-lactone hydrolase